MKSKSLGVVVERIKHFLLVVKRHSPYPEIVGLLFAIVSVFCSYLLIKWNTIPVYDYYIDAEYFCPDSIKDNLQTGVALFIEPDELLNSYTNKSEGNESLVVSIEDTTQSFLANAEAKKTNYKHRDKKTEEVVSQKLQYYTGGEFDDTISSILRGKEKPDRLFFVHLYSCWEQENIFVNSDTNVFYFAKDTLAYSQIKDSYCISILDRKIDSIFHKHDSNKRFLSDEHIYSHCCVLKVANNSEPFTNTISLNTKRMTYRKNRLQTLLMPKDISRAYYRISFSSWTIPTYNLRFNFRQDVVFESLPDNYQVNINSLEIPNHGTSIIQDYNSVKIYVEFPDGENTQTIRTFFMALIITGLLKEFVKSIYRSYKKYTKRFMG